MNKNIIIDYSKILGKPLIKGTRISVEIILKKLSEGMNNKDILEAYPSLKEKDILASIEYSLDLIKMEEPIAV